MWAFVIFIKNSIVSIADLLDRVIFNVNGVSISLFDIMLSLIVTGFIIAVFWKGART